MAQFSFLKEDEVFLVDLEKQAFSESLNEAQPKVTCRGRSSRGDPAVTPRQGAFPFCRQSTPSPDLGVSCAGTSTKFLSVASYVPKVGRDIPGHLNPCPQCREDGFGKQNYSQLKI